MLRVYAQSGCQQSGMVGGRSQHLLFQGSQRLRHFRRRQDPQFAGRTGFQVPWAI